MIWYKRRGWTYMKTTCSLTLRNNTLIRGRLNCQIISWFSMIWQFATILLGRGTLPTKKTPWHYVTNPFQIIVHTSYFSFFSIDTDTMTKMKYFNSTFCQMAWQPTNVNQSINILFRKWHVTCIRDIEMNYKTIS